jgi:hypothetical protein
MKVLATEDVAAQPLADFRAELVGDYGEPTEEGRFFFKSLDAPSWVRLVAELAWWQQALAAAAALYVAELVKEAAKETWKSRAKVIAATVNAARGLKHLAGAVCRLKSSLSSRTEVIVSIPEPHEYFGAQLRLNLEDQSLAEVELALFVHYLPAVSALIAEHKTKGVRAATGYFLELQDSANLLVWWFDGETLKRNEALITLAAREV